MNYSLKQNYIQEKEQQRRWFDERIGRKKLNNIHELEFTLFCIESLAEALHKDGASVYQELSSGKNFLQNYIIPEYGALHTQGKEYILQELLSVMKEWGVQLWMPILFFYKKNTPAL